MVMVQKKDTCGHVNAFPGKTYLDCESVFPKKSHSGLKIGRMTRQGAERGSLQRFLREQAHEKLLC